MQNFSILNKENYYRFDNFTNAKNENKDSELSLFSDKYNDSYLEDNPSSDKSYFDNYSVFNMNDKNYQKASITSLYEYSNKGNEVQKNTDNQDFYKIFNGVRELFK